MKCNNQLYIKTIMNGAVHRVQVTLINTLTHSLAPIKVMQCKHRI